MRQLLLCAAIIILGSTIPGTYAESVPDWVKNTAGWWATDKKSETEFVNAIEFLVKDGIIHVKSPLTPTTYAEMWTANKINDEQFIAKIGHVIEQQKGQSHGLPEWLQDNAGFWAAKILTDSDFNFNGN